MPKIIKKGKPVDKPRWVKWMGMNGTKESAPLNCFVCNSDFVLIKGEFVMVRDDCLDKGRNIIRYFIQCPNCRHRANYERAVVESNAA